MRTALDNLVESLLCIDGFRYWFLIFFFFLSGSKINFVKDMTSCLPVAYTTLYSTHQLLFSSVFHFVCINYTDCMLRLIAFSIGYHQTQIRGCPSLHLASPGSIFWFGHCLKSGIIMNMSNFCSQLLSYKVASVLNIETHP